MIDIHTHLLFGVDDGPETFEESIAMLEHAKAQGIDAMILTPHYRHGMFPYPKDRIEEHFAKLYKSAKEIGIDIYLGTEQHINSMTIEYIENGRIRLLSVSNAFEMGRTAAHAALDTLLLKKRPENETIYIPSTIFENK